MEFAHAGRMAPLATDAAHLPVASYSCKKQMQVHALYLLVTGGHLRRIAHIIDACPPTLYSEQELDGVEPEIQDTTSKAEQEEMAPMKLHGMPLAPNVMRVAAVLNEMGVDFEIIPVDLPTGAHKQPDFLAFNVRTHAPACLLL